MFLDSKQCWKKEVMKLFCFNVFEINNSDFLPYSKNTNQFP